MKSKVEKLAARHQEAERLDKERIKRNQLANEEFNRRQANEQADKDARMRDLTTELSPQAIFNMAVHLAVETECSHRGSIGGGALPDPWARVSALASIAIYRQLTDGNTMPDEE